MRQAREYYVYSSARGMVIAEVRGYDAARKRAGRRFEFCRADRCTVRPAEFPYSGRQVWPVKTA